MGNESSTVVEDHVPPQTLEGRTIEAVAKYIHEKDVQRIVVMVRVAPSEQLACPELTLDSDWRRYKYFGRHTGF